MIERIGILGGTFNPVHCGHLALAQEAWYRYDLARVLFVPASQNPLRNDIPGEHATDDQRLEMLRLACEADTRFVVDALELRRGGPSFTIDTLQRQRELHPQAEIYLIVGADAAKTLSQWKQIEKYSGLCLIAVANRPGSELEAEDFNKTMQSLGVRIEMMPVPPLDISSTELRKRLRQGKPIRYYIPDAVTEYIHTHKLYKN